MLRSVPNGAICESVIGTGCYANNPVNKMCFGERLACLVLQRGESEVLAWITELQGDLEHP
ncbi:MAG TPA: hypothetical protein VG409_04535, partial [Actinomycetota bacterium]|nr:hypothetical protein [Actinomycetota bacterium]